MTVVPYPQPPQQAARELLTYDQIVERSEMIANTEFVPKGLRGNQPAIIAAVLFGKEVGLEPMQSLWSIAVIDGRPTMAAEAMRALILSAGHEIWPEEVNTTRATMAARRRDSKNTVRVTWTLDDAKRARIAGKPNWQLYPRQMLVARATAELARQVFADVIHGMAATEEFDVEGDVGGVDDVEATGDVKPKATRRRRRTPPAVSLPAPDPVPSASGPETSEGVSGAPEATEPDSPSKPAMNKLMALFGRKGFHDRVERLAYTSKMLDRPIASSTELSAVDVSMLITALTALKDAPPAEKKDATNESDSTLPQGEQEVIDALEDELDARQVDEEEPPPLPDEL